MTPRAMSKSSTAKKDKLNKKEREAAEKHLLHFGESIRQFERHSDSHKYRPRSSYFPSRVMSSILDTLLVIHFPSKLEEILNNSWAYYFSHGTALFDLIIEIQTSIKVQRNNTRELTLGKKSEKRRAARAADDEGASDPPLVSDPEPFSESPSRKRPALEQITNTTKRQRAPRSVQPTVTQVLEGYCPQYRTRRSAFIAEGLPGGNDGKENGGRRVSVRLRKT